LFNIKIDKGDDKMKQLKGLLLVIFAQVLLLSLVIHPSTSYAASSEGTVALTSPPPDKIVVYGYFDPNFKYLKEGSSKIADNGNQTVTLSANTSAYSTVSSLGATLYLQKWDGQNWVTVGEGVPKSKKSDYLFSASVEKTATKGYYYRVRSVHWITNDNVNEEGVTYSSSILVK